MSFGLGYMTVDSRADAAGAGSSDEAVDYEWLAQQPLVRRRAPRAAPFSLLRSSAPRLAGRSPRVPAAARRFAPQSPVDGIAARHVRHVRLAEELEVVCDGLSRRGVIMKPGKPFDVYVAQPDAMLAITQESGGM